MKWKWNAPTDRMSHPKVKLARLVRYYVVHTEAVTIASALSRAHLQSSANDAADMICARTVVR